MKALEIKNLEKIYDNKFHALKGLNLEIEEGDFFALLGPNGAGKSTTIGIISTLVNKSSGIVKVFGKDLDKNPYELKKYIGLVPQEFNLNLWEPCIEILINQAGYFGIDRKDAKKRAEFLLKELDLFEKRFDMVRELSGGMKRRLMIARALIHEPRLLILDEPTAGVDIEIRRSMWKIIKELNRKGTTIILTTHYLEEAENLCKNIAIIDKGIIVENTSMKKLLAKLELESFVLDLKNEIETLPEFKFEAKIIDKNTIEIKVLKNENLNEVFKELSKANIEVLSMRNKTNRLEELFLNLIEEKNE
ncbi:ABC transporter ATP-binding protein [bacterium]|nr:ABC transporter ATP-binding protein [bacterium]